MLEIIPVTTRAHARTFLDLSWRVYPEPTRWVPPLWLHFRSMMGPLDSSDRRFLLAVEDGQVVARVGVKVHGREEGQALHFGFFEAIEGCVEAVRLLFDEAQRLAPGLPMRGPYHFRQEDPYSGLLVDGFDRDPSFLMPYNPPGYRALLEAAGFVKTRDLLAYEYTPDDVRLDVMEGRARRARERGIEVRTMDGSRIEPEVRALIDVFNDALSSNWGFEPFDEEHVRDMILLARYLLKPSHVWLARQDGRDVGALILLPDLNPLLRASRGRITPGLILGYLLRHRRTDAFRGYAIGVRNGYRAVEVSSALVHALLEEGTRLRWRLFEVSWVVEDNVAMNALATATGGRRTKTYRLLERAGR